MDNVLLAGGDMLGIQKYNIFGNYDKTEDDKHSLGEIIFLAVIFMIML